MVAAGIANAVGRAEAAVAAGHRVGRFAAYRCGHGDAQPLRPSGFPYLAKTGAAERRIAAVRGAAGRGADAGAPGAPADRIVELDWWQRHRHGEVEMTLTPAQHWSKRWALGDRNRALWGGFAAKGGGAQLWYPGDTGYHPELFARIAEHLGKVDVALLPIGAYRPRWFLQAQHIDPAEAVEIYRILRPGARWRCIGGPSC
ncbi:hypothetical protein DK843_00035 [Chromobacterium phragmitis]|uniref:Metallo-beta-lactamase domain-containing protein n=1 Tax=Chromobacterium phragmitis TaxID=2202141 RepID=A0A344UC34_9NEIS|nr:hypothetical protein DK843_00035 [Chromobacterium phragmitis]